MKKWMTVVAILSVLQAEAQHAAMGIGYYFSPKTATVNLSGGIITKTNWLAEGNLIGPLIGASPAYFQVRGGRQFVKKKLHFALFAGYSLSIQANRQLSNGITAGTTIYYAYRDVFYKFECSVNNKNNFAITFGAMVPFSINNKPQYRLAAFWLK
jgi:hypothetical protein